jgi:alpha-mannosidase
MSEKNYGVSLLNDSKYGYSAQGSTMRLSLLRSPLEPDPQADRGDHEFTYSIYPHKGRWSDSRTVQMAYDLNQPLMAKLEDAHAGKLPAVHSFLGISKTNVVLGAMKKAEDSDALILRFYESAGKKTNATVYLPYKPEHVSEADLLENATLPMTANGKKLDAAFGPYEIKTLKVEF